MHEPQRRLLLRFTHGATERTDTRDKNDQDVSDKNDKNDIPASCPSIISERQRMASDDRAITSSSSSSSSSSSNDGDDDPTAVVGEAADRLPPLQHAPVHIHELGPTRPDSKMPVTRSGLLTGLCCPPHLLSAAACCALPSRTARMSPVDLSMCGWECVQPCWPGWQRETKKTRASDRCSCAG